MKMVIAFNIMNYTFGDCMNSFIIKLFAIQFIRIIKQNNFSSHNDKNVRIHNNQLVFNNNI